MRRGLTIVCAAFFMSAARAHADGPHGPRIHFDTGVSFSNPFDLDGRGIGLGSGVEFGRRIAVLFRLEGEYFPKVDERSFRSQRGLPATAPVDGGASNFVASSLGLRLSPIRTNPRPYVTAGVGLISMERSRIHSVDFSDPTRPYDYPRRYEQLLFGTYGFGLQTRRPGKWDWFAGAERHYATGIFETVLEPWWRIRVGVLSP
jgi:hypothetical protein